MFQTSRSLRWGAWAALLVAVAYLAAAAAVPMALRGPGPFTLADPQKQFDDLVAHYHLGILLGLAQFVQTILGALAVTAVAFCAARLRPTRAALGGAFAVAAFLVHAARSVWFAAIEPAAALRYAGGDEATRQSMLVFLQLNMLYRHFFNWLYIFFAGLGFALLAWALWPQARRRAPFQLVRPNQGLLPRAEIPEHDPALAAPGTVRTALAVSLGLAALAHALHFPATMAHYYSVHILNRRLPLLGLLTETAVWLFPGLAFLMAALWLKGISEQPGRGTED